MTVWMGVGKLTYVVVEVVVFRNMVFRNSTDMRVWLKGLLCGVLMFLLFLSIHVSAISIKMVMTAS